MRATTLLTALVVLSVLSATAPRAVESRRVATAGAGAANQHDVEEHEDGNKPTPTSTGGRSFQHGRRGANGDESQHFIPAENIETTDPTLQSDEYTGRLVHIDRVHREAMPHQGVWLLVVVKGVAEVQARPRLEKRP